MEENRGTMRENGNKATEVTRADFGIIGKRILETKRQPLKDSYATLRKM